MGDLQNVIDRQQTGSTQPLKVSLSGGDTATIATAVSAQGTVGGATQGGFVPLFLVDAALSAVSQSDGQEAQGRVDANGALWVQMAGALSPLTDGVSIGYPSAQIWKSYNDTSSRAAGSAQILWTPASGKKINITQCTIASYGTTAARMFLFLAANADLTYTAGSDQPVFVGSFAPSATVKPGVVLNFTPPLVSANADYKLLYQNDAALSVDITVYGFES